MNRARVTALVLVALIPTFREGLAAGTKVLVMAAAGGDSDETRLVWAARAAVGELVGLENVDLPSLLDVDMADALELGRRQAREGVSAFEQFDLPAAKRFLENASLLLNGHPEAREETCVVLHRLAEVELALDQSQSAQDALVRAFRLPGCVDAKLGEWSPSMRFRREKAKKAVNDGKIGALRVLSNVKPCAVFINGKFAGMNKNTIVSLPVGSNHLRMSADGYGEINRIININAGRTTRVKTTFKRASRAGLLSRIVMGLPEHVDDEEFPAGLHELKALSFANQGILVERRGDVAHAALYDLKRNLRVRMITVMLDDDINRVGRDVITALYAGYDPLRPGLYMAEPELDKSHVTANGDGDGQWIWYAVGGGIALVVSAVLIATIDGEDGIEKEPGTGAIVVRF